MAKEICISSTPHETRLAILEDDQLAEIYYERENEYTLAGSIYNGRVTRVLPGMQSAFVDIGLERDAFLYVTDFLELEDQEESEEIERAAATGPQTPRQIRSSGDSDRGQRQRGDRRDRRPAPEAAPEAEEVELVAPEAPLSAEFSEPSRQEGSDEQGVRRWRGRRRRRSGRSQSSSVAEGAPNAESQAEDANLAPSEAEVVQTTEIHATAAPRAERAPEPFVLPGESLSKYGGTPPPETRKAPEAEPPVRPAPTFRPSTLIEAPLQWDGSGLLPGESLARHRGRASEPEVGVDAEPQGTFADAELSPQPAAAHEGERVEEELIEETSETPLESTVIEASAEPEDESTEVDPEPDASASHHVDPLPPSSFRLFGLGGKKKKDEPSSGDPAQAPIAPSSSVSAFAPGAGLVEEETIEGSEFDAPGHPLRQKSHEHDLDEYEEETLQTQIRSGAIGEMLQEAHLDHRIDLNLDIRNGDEVEEEAYEMQDGEAETSAGSQSSEEGLQPQRRERGGRGRRGRAPGGRPGDRRGPSRRSAQTSDLPIISDLLKPGQEILVQIAKEPIAKKGARITSHIALPGRFLVFMPTVSHVGVSRKIASDEERNRLKRILISERGEASGGFIVRTAAEGSSEEELRADLRFLIHLWDEIKQRSESSKSPALIYHDLSLIERILRDQVSANFSSIWVDSQEDYERIVRFLNRFSPTLVRRVKLYTKETPLFEHFGIQDEISKALRSKVWLKSGGSIVINQTEALVAIDINTGKYVGKTARLEDTIVKTNLDAIPEIVRQIRLRDLGGIIIIDFIDMDERKNRFKVMAALEEALKSDRAPTKVLQFNDFGLVAITRKRVKQSLERTLSVPCPTCQATGMVKSPVTVCNEIYVELRKMRRHFENPDVLLRVNPETVKVLKSNNARWLTEFEELVGRNILVKSDPALHPEQFDIQG